MPPLTYQQLRRPSKTSHFKDMTANVSVHIVSPTTEEPSKVRLVLFQTVLYP